MKKILSDILKQYLLLFPEEEKEQKQFNEFLNNCNDVTDWNNFKGHVVASGFIYSKKDNKFLVLYHNDLKVYLYPGGHIDESDKTPLDAARREIFEETGLLNIKQLVLCNNELIPIDIDTHIIPYDAKRNLPEHYHFDFSYFFVVDKIENVKIEEKEVDNYKLVNIEELYNNNHYGKMMFKIERMLSKDQ